MGNSPLNLIDIVYSIRKNLKSILLFTSICIMTALIALFFVTPLYKSTTLFVAANTSLVDKGRFYNQNLQGLYAFTGGEDELEVLYSISKLDTIYYQLVDAYDLISFYKISEGEPSERRFKAMIEIKNDIEVLRTANKQIQLTLFTKSPLLSSQIINTLVVNINKYVQNIWRNQFEKTIGQLFESNKIDSIALLQFNTTTNDIVNNSKREALTQQLIANEKILLETQVANNTLPAALLVLDYGKPSLKKDKPQKVLILIITLILSFSTASIFCIFKNTNKT